MIVKTPEGIKKTGVEWIVSSARPKGTPPSRQFARG
jgi:hypothetical protein